ncbi:MAG: glycosyltransferase [Firmicutes bacterium]|nr:glycosyltransferase [Bacillota bacterium]
MVITFILKGTVEALPPMLPRLIYASKKGIKVNFICSKMQEKSKNLLESAGIVCRETLHCDKFMGKRSRIMDWIGFKFACKSILGNEFSDNDMVYICSADTALCLNSVLNRYKYILQINELYDKIILYRKGLKKYVRNAKALVVPEFCRANIYMYWYSLKNKPYIIPNIPYILSLESKQRISDTYASNVIEKLKHKKIFIYQGQIDIGNRNLTVIAEALRIINNSEYALVLMGRNHNNSVERLREVYPKTYFIHFIAAPYHLEVTSHAHIALLAYDRVSLNNLFCAPNKIYEYSGLGIPMLGNDIPGLYYTIEQENMGVCTSYSDVDEVVKAIEKIESNYAEYSQNSKSFYNNNDLNKAVYTLLKDALGDNYFEK